MVVIVIRGFSFFFQAEDGIRDLVRSRGLGDVYKRQPESPILFLKVKKPLRKSDFRSSFDLPTPWEEQELSLIHI